MTSREPAHDSPHLRIYRFDPGTRFEGEVVGALERMERGDGPRLLDALFVARDAERHELQAVDLATGRADGTVSTLLDFRLDPGKRRAVTERTLAGRRGGVPAAVIEALGAGLEQGSAMLVVLVAGPAPGDLEDAVRRCAGHRVADRRVEGATLAELGAELRAVL